MLIFTITGSSPAASMNTNKYMAFAQNDNKRRKNKQSNAQKDHRVSSALLWVSVTHSEIMETWGWGRVHVCLRKNQPQLQLVLASGAAGASPGLIFRFSLESERRKRTCLALVRGPHRGGSRVVCVMSHRSVEWDVYKPPGALSFCWHIMQPLTYARCDSSVCVRVCIRVC